MKPKTFILDVINRDYLFDSTNIYIYIQEELISKNR